MKKIFLLTVMALSVSLFSCSGNTETAPAAVPATGAPVTPPTPGKIEMFEAVDLNMWFEKKEDFIVVDVRTPDEFLTGSLPGAQNIDFMAADFKEQVGKLDKSKTYAVVCQVGKRSAASAQIMADMGFQHVWALNGGLESWTKEGYPLAQ